MTSVDSRAPDRLPTETEDITEEQLAAFIGRGDDALFDLDRADAEASFAEFVKQAWHILDPATQLVWGWVMDAICIHLEAIHTGDLQKVLINVPPGTCKTLLTCVFFPAWEWGPRNQPHHRYIKATYSETFSIDANTKLRRLIKSDWYQKRWGDRVTVADDQDSKTYFGNTATGWCMAISVGGLLIGYRGTRFIIDDPHNTLKAESDVDREKTVKWYFDGTSTRHNDPANPVEIIIMQRLHEYDVAGAILKHPTYYGFEHLCIEMEFEPDHPIARKKPSKIAWIDPRCSLEEAQQFGALCFPERYPPHAVENLKEKFRRGEEGILYAEAGQLQQWPIPRAGAMFDTAKFVIMKMTELVKLGFPLQLTGGVVRGWDLAGSTGKTSPYTCGTAMVRWAGKIVVLDCRRERREATLVGALVGEVADMDDASWGTVKQSLPQDPGQAGKAQVAHYAGEVLAGHVFVFSLESGEKEIRALPWAAQVNAGNVILVEAEWNAPYIEVHKMFPAGRIKDDVDASSRTYAELLTIKELPPPFGGYCLDLTEVDDGQWSYIP